MGVRTAGDEKALARWRVRERERKRLACGTPSEFGGPIAKRRPARAVSSTYLISKQNTSFACGVRRTQIFFSWNGEYGRAYSTSRLGSKNPREAFWWL
jgi:hypothetical protein